MTAPGIIENVTCLGCGCACDDIGITVRDGRITEARNACALGVEWFGDGQVPARSCIDGRDVSLDEAVGEAARTLAGASRPLVYLAPDVSCETQREGAAIADMLRARLDSVTSSTVAGFVLSGQERGYASATLGEIRNRADVILFWSVDLERRYPRFTSRYAPDPIGVHVPDGRRSRTVISVDVGAAVTLAAADHRTTIDPAHELATLTALQAIVRSPDTGSATFARSPGAAWDTARDLAPMLLSGRYVALVYDAEPDERTARSPQRFDALGALGRALNERTRCAAIALRGGGNRSGADSVLTSQTGYPMTVNFGRGYPRYGPHDGLAAAARDGNRSDVALVVGNVAALPSAVSTALSRVHTVTIGPRASESPLGDRTITIDTGMDGIHTGGTAFRTDDVPLPLRAVMAGFPSAVDTVRSIASLVRRMTR